ncbi:FxsA family membrane protein [Streptomyces sp. NPDC059740]|uniref:FxsA family membrane protein n=1 Tax=Streptomyces sp. NPDC059740 TaxID=3346926 RepID=UPI003653E629
MTQATPQGSRPDQRSRLRRLLPLAVAAWVALEIWLLVLVADAVGGWVVFLLLLAGIVVGASLVKRAGRRAWRDLRQSVGAPGGGSAEEGATRRTPRAQGSGTLAMLGGLLIMVPGLISDVVGLVCLLPPVQRSARRRVERYVSTRAAHPGPLGDAFRQARMRRPDGKVVPGEVVHEEEQPRPGGRQDPPLNP